MGASPRQSRRRGRARLRLAAASYATLRRVRRSTRDAAFRLLEPMLRGGEKPLPPLEGLHKVLLVHLNHRLGNTLLVTPAVASLCARLAGAEVDFLGAPVAAPVLAGLGLRRVYTVPRWRLASPLHAFRLLRALRRERYEATIHLGLSGHSMGALLTALSGAPHRIGCPGGHANALFTSVVERPRARHRVDAILQYAGRLGAEGRGERTLVLASDERRAAQERLAAALGPAADRAVGIFVGARAKKGKGWPLESFRALADALRSRGLALLVFLGPEERRHAGEIQRALGHAVYVQGEELRRVAALLACCRVVVTPDSGPMHLAVAVGAPTVAIFRDSDPGKWGPRPPHGEAILDRGGRDVEAVLAAVLRQYAGGRRDAGVEAGPACQPGAPRPQRAAPAGSRA